jgi:hypothetical protein
MEISQYWSYAESVIDWIGGFSDYDPYYYRIHSPVAFIEFDFHCGSEYLDCLN